MYQGASSSETSLIPQRHVLGRSALYNSAYLPYIQLYKIAIRLRRTNCNSDDTKYYCRAKKINTNFRAIKYFTGFYSMFVPNKKDGLQLN